MSKIDTAAIQARCEVASPGPWEKNNFSGGIGGVDIATNTVKSGNVGFAYKKADLDFIMNARQDIPALLDDRDALLGEIDRLRNALESETARADEAVARYVEAIYENKANHSVLSDRDHWKALSEALEQAHKRLSGHTVCAKIINGCDHHYDYPPNPCDGWQFDQARFTADSNSPQECP